MPLLVSELLFIEINFFFEYHAIFTYVFGVNFLHCDEVRRGNKLEYEYLENQQ